MRVRIKNSDFYCCGTDVDSKGMWFVHSLGISPYLLCIKPYIIRKKLR